MKALNFFKGEGASAVLYVAYHIGAIITFVKLSFFDGGEYNWWNWIIIIPLNLFLAEMWPIYWLILRPLMSFIFG